MGGEEQVVSTEVASRPNTASWHLPHDADALARHYRKLLLAGGLTFVLFVALTVWGGLTRRYTEELGLANQRVGESAIRLKATVKAASDHLNQLTRWAEDFPRHVPNPGPRRHRVLAEQALAQAQGGNLTLDNLATLPPEDRLANMIATSQVARPRPNGGPSNLDLALSIADRLEYAHRTSPFLRWSYFFSARKDLLVISPWQESVRTLADEADCASFLQHSWDYEITDRGRPENNPSRRGYWTKAYADQAGAGLMVSGGAPVYWGDEFVGVMGVDVLLSFLTDFVREFPDPDGVLIITNEHGQLLADRLGVAAAGKDALPVEAVLPKSFPPASTWLKERMDGGTRIGEYHVIAASIGDPNWTILYLLPRSTVAMRVLTDFLPQLTIVALLILGLLVVHRSLWRMYVAPALNIVAFVAREDRLSDGVVAEPPPLPEQWRPWVGAMTRAFAERRQYLRELRENNALLERRVAERTADLSEANRRLETLAAMDPLTGAVNRRRLFELLEVEAKRKGRSAPPMSVLLLDVDHFKRINDTHGHAAGDAVLRVLVERATATIRTIDTVCRYGGEEFVILLPQTPNEGAAQIAERLREALKAGPVVFDGTAIAVTASFGVATHHPDETVNDMLRRADALMYQAKTAGRDRVMI